MISSEQQKATRIKMQNLASVVDDVLNARAKTKVGFALFVFRFDAPEGQRVNYVSNASREDMLVAVREWLARAEGRVQETETTQ